MKIEYRQHGKARPRNKPEQNFHIQVADLLTRCLPKDALFHHSPNGGMRNVIEAVNFKKMGTKAGFPDIIIIYQRRAYFIELKAPGQYLSDEQRDIHARLQDCGAAVETCRTIEQIANRLHAWDIPFKNWRESA